MPVYKTLTTLKIRIITCLKEFILMVKHESRGKQPNLARVSDLFDTHTDGYLKDKYYSRDCMKIVGGESC